MASLSISPKEALILVEMAETIRGVLAGDMAYPEDLVGILEEYDAKFSTKPNVSCRCGGNCACKEKNADSE